MTEIHIPIREDKSVDAIAALKSAILYLKRGDVKDKDRAMNVISFLHENGL